MLLTKNVNIRINNINKKYYINYFKDIKLNDIIMVDVNLLTSGSKVKIDAKCDDCGIIKNMEYSLYYKSAIKNNKNGIYYCTKCVKNHRTKETMFKKYGVEYPIQNIDIKNKIKNTNFERYGYEYPLQNIKIQEKQISTNIRKYNVSYVSLNNDIRKKQTINKILNLIPKYTNYDFLSYDYESKLIELKCDKNHLFTISRKLLYGRFLENTIICPKCNPIDKKISGKEIGIFNFIETCYGDHVIKNSKNIINPYELDIYLPKLKLAFEFNGLYWHSELFKDSNYHKIKTDLCLDKGIQLIHIYEDDWVYKQNIIKSIILNKLNKNVDMDIIELEKMHIKEINDNDLVKNFLNDNHIQGYIKSSIKIGIFYKNQLVSIMIIAKLKKSKNNDYEILRYCNKLNFNITDGLQKLFNYFLDNFKYDKIIFNIDRTYSNGEYLEMLGFKLESTSQPNYYYILDRKRKNKFNYKKSNLIKKGFDSNKTEHQIMFNNKNYRIYDSGYNKYVYTEK